MKKFFISLIVICSVLIVFHVIDFILIMDSDATYGKMLGPYGSIISVILLIVMIVLLNKQYRKQ